MLIDISFTSIDGNTNESIYMYTASRISWNCQYRFLLYQVWNKVASV